MELSKPRQGNKRIPLGCRFGVFSSLFLSFPTSFALTTPKHSTLRPMVSYTHPTNMEDPPPQTTHSRQMPAPPMGRSEDRACQGRSRRTHGGVKGRRVEVPPQGGRGGFIHKPLSKLASSSSIPFSPISAARTRGVTHRQHKAHNPTAPALMTKSTSQGSRWCASQRVKSSTTPVPSHGTNSPRTNSSSYMRAVHNVGFFVAVQLARLLEVKRSPAGVLALGGEGKGACSAAAFVIFELVFAFDCE